MHHTNADAPPGGPPRRAALPGQPPPPVGAPGEALPGGGRARAAGRRIPTTALSGYEQILAARAAMRAEVERAAAVDRLGAFAPVFAPAERDPRRARPRAEPRRRPGLILSGLAAAPVCALLALAWVEPPRATGALPAGPAQVAGSPPPAFDVAAATATAPAAEADGPASAAAQDPDAPSSRTAEVEPEAPGGNAPSGPERAEVEPAPLPVEHAGPALAARNQDAISPAADAAPAESPRSGAPWSMLDRVEAEERTLAAAPEPAAAEAAVAEEASAPAAAAAEAAVPEAAIVAEAAVAEGAPAPAAVAEAVAVAATSDLADAIPDTMDADTTGFRSRQEAPPAEAGTGTKPALPPVKLAAPAQQPPPLPPSVPAAPAKNRGGDPPAAPPARAVRGAANGASPSAEARCRAIIVKFQLGEETSHADRTYLQTSCGARRR